MDVFVRAAGALFLAAVAIAALWIASAISTMW